jgi:hypothetical protein
METKTRRSPSPSETLDARRKDSVKSVDVLSCFLARWSLVFPNHPTVTECLPVYLEALSDLTASQIERGCREAEKTMEQFPKPGHIRQGLARASRGDFERLGPRRIRWNENESMTAEERKAAADQCAELSRGLPVRPVTPPRKKLSARPVKPIERQLAEMRAKGYL